mmetsp:Transcript_42198/g.101536  ORF Transcript_42198/g.101536 Transcript_42198/m.101536 type:complete len:839 (-) Transcript_42198:78-2594(-)
MQIMNKCAAYARQGNPLGIVGAIAAQTKGKIYIESYHEPSVGEAIGGIRGVMAGTARLVPIPDMTTVMTVIPKKKPVSKGDWVRMTRHHYKGDLARVEAVRESGLKCIVKCVPRIDFTALKMDGEEARNRKRSVRPPQKFFNPQELAAVELDHRRSRQRFPGMDVMCDNLDGNYYHNGFLLKEVTVGTMVKPVTDSDPPSIEELQKFVKKAKDDEEDDLEDETSKMAGSLLDELAALQGQKGFSKSESSDGGLLVGDKIEVVEGDLINLKGKIISMGSTTIKVTPLDKSLEIGMTEIEFLKSQVRKYIAEGFHVKVMSGRYVNETGTVVAVEPMDDDNDCIAVLLTDVTSKEIQVRTSILKESSEKYSGQDKLASYELYDLVRLSGGGSANEVAVIVRVGREDFTVINNHGITREVRPEELRGKVNAQSNRNIAVDVQGNQIRAGDQVQVTEGPHKATIATIKRLFRSQLFLYSQTRTENAGIFVVRSRQCFLSGTKAMNQGSAETPGMSPFATPQSQPRGAPARGKKDDALIGKTVRIQAGQWKAYQGTVCNATPTHVVVELHTRLKKVTVVRERVAVVGDKFGAIHDDQNDPNNLNGPMGGSYGSGITPMHGGITPMHGGATPMHGGATPMHDNMVADEVWRPGVLDQEDPNPESPTNNGGGWGADNSTINDFGSTANDDAGWGSSNQAGGSVWAPETNESLETSQVATGIVNTSQPSSTMETHVAAENEETAVWYMDRVCVQLKSDDKPAVIKEVNADKTALVELDDHSTRTVRFSEVSRIEPKEKDTVLVIGGADVGVEGELVCIDGSDAILKDGNEDFKIVDFVHLAKVSSES